MKCFTGDRHWTTKRQQKLCSSVFLDLCKSLPVVSCVNTIHTPFSEAENEREREVLAAVKIQSWFRGQRNRAYLRYFPVTSKRRVQTRNETSTVWHRAVKISSKLYLSRCFCALERAARNKSSGQFTFVYSGSWTQVLCWFNENGEDFLGDEHIGSASRCEGFQGSRWSTSRPQRIGAPKNV